MLKLSQKINLKIKVSYSNRKKERKSYIGPALHYFTADPAVRGVGEGLQPAMTAASSERGSY